MSWSPTLDDGQPAYLALADAIARDVRRGKLAAGERLPTQRALAGRLGITPGTVARAYLEAERRGLTRAHVGRGAFVRGDGVDAAQADGWLERGLAPESVVDLSLNHPPTGPESGVDTALAEVLSEIASGGGLDALLRLQPARGTARHREIGARWLSERAPDTDPERLVVCSGGQHALAVALGALCRRGDVLLTETLTYPGVLTLAQQLGLQVRAVAQDEYGLRPDALREACARYRPQALYCIPTLQNPTTAVMPAARRDEVAQVLREADVPLVEDDVYGPLFGPEVEPISTRLPELGHLVVNAGKSLAPGLRVGFLHAPRARLPELERLVRDNGWSVAPLMVELVSRWIDDGTAARVTERRRTEAASRIELARRTLGDWSLAAHPRGFHLWLALPDPWNARDFVAAAAERGVRLAPTEAFVAGGPVPRRVRLCLGREPSMESLRGGLERLAGLLSGQ
ncbi:PLP-dependent aminotransferase family protein [Engelhardtia mirabilis]|uniref:Putative HTH-type transcriptional regulator YjiR n=1 Tax=Engelhardtia mirabilis TaxID=2528011 RepID=A0A518BES9_9BACT|nr:putative HTH-type transcriptional regulator YjiR [Planctomycetes bacterium Pla133]QDU99816.1 putative HTH-type transcriptional regulator YjiR [Planctomycetes bacterium Pla86]